MSYTLGLDLGPNSIGWALVDEPNQRIIDLGVRVFPEGVDNFDTSKEISRNEARRIARGMRRQIARRARRKQRLREALIEANLWPTDPHEQVALELLDPYALRARAVDPEAPKLSRYELGRVILHLNQRRGFFSHRKDQTRDSETQGMLAAISSLEQKLGERTLGQFLHEKTVSFDPIERKEDDKVRRRHTHRRMLEAELLRIAERHADILTPELLFGKLGRQSLPPSRPRRRTHELRGLSHLQAFGIHGILFFQRAIYWPKSMIGLCELEPKEPRCPRADRAAQRFRMLQEVNNLRYIDPDTKEEKSLTAEQRQLILEKLATKEKLEFNGRGGIKAALGFLESVKFNLERGERSSIKGHVTDVLMSRAVKRWHKLPEDIRDRIVRLLLEPGRTDDAIRPRLIEAGLDEAETEAALGVDLPGGYLRLSLKAINRLLPYMERGYVYQMTAPENSAIHAAGYVRPDELQRRVFDKLPDPTRVADAPIGEIPNPIVRRTLVELRKLVNAIIREYGPPDAIHVEMARSVKQGERERKQYNMTLREREALRDAAAQKLRESGIKITRSAINRLLLWEEQDHICIYTGKPISFTQLYNGETDIDHILPYSRCLDDSLMNKVVCFREANDDKGQKSPYEWLAGRDPARYERVCHRASRLPYPKYRRFLQKTLELDKFIARQLVDTSYISRVTVEYLQCLFDHEARRHGAVLGIKGQLTAELRHQWGLNDLLSADAIDTKSRDDHRHHAIDALIVALTDRSRLQGLTRIRKAGGVLQTGEALEYPWENFRDEVKRRIRQVNVSHRAERKIAGALHEDTLYGVHRVSSDKIVPGEFVVRKKLESLSPNEVEFIRDQAVREAIKQRLAEHGIDVGRGRSVPSNLWKAALCNPENPVRLVGKRTGTLGPPIYKVRIIKKEQTIQPIRDGERVAYVKPGATHHISIFELNINGRSRRIAYWTTMLEAARRVAQRQQALKRAKERLEAQLGIRIKPRDPRLGREMSRIAHEIPIITRVHPDHPEAKFLFSLSRGEMVLAEVDGKEELLVYNTSASTQGQIYFYHHADARPKSGKDKTQVRRKFVFTANTLKARKVTVDYLGRIRWAND